MAFMPSRTLRAARARLRTTRRFAAIEQAGAVSLTAFQVLLEFQRDWSRKEHYEEVMAVVKEHGGAYGQGIEYVATMVQKAPASRNDKQRRTRNKKGNKVYEQ